MRLCRFVLYVFLTGIALLMPALSQQLPRAVLIINEADPSSGAPTTFSATLRNTLNNVKPYVAVYGETLDLRQFSEPNQEKILQNYIEQKYSDVRFGAIVAVGASALDIVRRWRSRLWTDVPVIFSAIDETTAGNLTLEPGITGIVMRRTIGSMLSAARAIAPKLKTVAVLGGSLEKDAYRRQYVREIRALPASVTVLNLTGKSLTQQMQQARHLPDRTVILYTSLFIDDAGERYSSPDALAEIAKIANRPIVVDIESLVGSGATGGNVLNNVSYGDEVAALVSRILNGEPVSTFPVMVSEFTKPIFDGRQLKRWDVAESKLPAQSEIRFRQEPVWKQYTWQILGIVTIVFLQSLILAYVLAERHRRQGVEKSLAESEERMTFAAVAANIGLWQLDRRTNEVWLTDHCRKMFGLSNDVLVTRDTFIDLVHPDDREAAISYIQGENADRPVVCDVRASRGEQPGWLRIRARSLPDKQDQLSGLFVDITDQKMAESEAALQQKEVAHLTRVSVLGELSGAIAHEINQPLTSILSNAQAALNFLGSKSPDLVEVEDALKEIVHEDQRAGEVIQRLRRLLKKGEQQTEVVDLNDLITSTATLLNSEIVSRGIEVEVDLAEPPPKARGDPVQLQQLLLNLVMNAMDAMSSSPEEAKVLTLCTGKTLTGVEIQVKDRGCGLNAADEGRIFDPFFTTKEHGIGLGLTICTTIAQSHGGKLTLANNDGGGTVAELSLPSRENLILVQ